MLDLLLGVVVVLLLLFGFWFLWRKIIVIYVELLAWAVEREKLRSPRVRRRPPRSFLLRLRGSRGPD